MPKLEMIATSSTSMNINLELVLHTEAIAEILSERRNSKKLTFEKKKLESYLSEFNIHLEKNDLPSIEMKRDYVTASCIYIFGEPILGLDINPDLKKSFYHFCWRKFGIENPLNLYFRRANYDEEKSENEEYEDKTEYLAVDEKTIQKDFAGSEKTKEKILRELNEISGNLLNDKKYSEDNHFTFIGMKDVCLPLLGIHEQRNNFSETEKMLKEKYGVFVFEIPYFDEE